MSHDETAFLEAPRPAPPMPGPLPLVEPVHDGARLVALIVRAEAGAPRTQFLTPPGLTQQAGFVVHPAGGEIPRHVHVPVERRVTGTPEVILVREGLLEADLYSEARDYLGTWFLAPGDILLLASGGHGFRCLDDTVLFEVKQGPYTGLAEKERF